MYNYKSAINTVLIACTLVILIAVSVFSAESEWTAEFKKDVKWMQLTPTGHLIVGSDEGLFSIDPSDGTILWKDENLKGMKEELFEIIPLTQYAVINKSKGFMGGLNKLTVIDYVSGKEKWNSDNLDIHTSAGQFIIPEKKALFLLGQGASGRPWPRLVNLEDGALIWGNKDFFKKRNPQMFKLSKFKLTIVGNQNPLVDTDETMITCMNGKAIRKWDLNTGQMIWETELKELKKASPALNFGYAPFQLETDKSVVYIPAVKSLYAVSTKDGSLVWGKKPAKLDGMPYQVELLDQGILVKGGPNSLGKDGKPYMMLLDPATGEHKWKKKFDKLKRSTGFVIKDNSAYVYSDKNIYKIDIATGTYEECAKKIKFEGKETPNSLRITDEGFSLTSSQNVMMVGFDGTIKFHTYHKAPGSSLFSKIASTAIMTAINVGSAADGISRAQRSSTGSASYSLMTSNPYMSKRFKATKSADKYMYILGNLKSDNEKGPGIAKVNKLTGKTENMIILKDKKPVYEVDNIESKIFYIKDKKKIICYSL